MPNNKITDPSVVPTYVLPPQERLKRHVTDFASVEIDANVPLKR